MIHDIFYVFGFTEFDYCFCDDFIFVCLVLFGCRGQLIDA